MNPTPCEFCGSEATLSTIEIPLANHSFENTVSACKTCREQIADPNTVDANHWRALNESIWSENPAVKAVAWRILTRLSTEGWAQDLLQQLDLDDALLAWAKDSGSDKPESSAASETRDSNGTVLKQGDSVTLIKDLEVKGAGFTAKRGTLVKNIVLTDDTALIEGKVNGTQIVLKTCFLKKSL